MPTTSPERAQRTRRFQLINDAYYVLSDAGRRREYDGARAYHGAGRGSGRRADAADDPAEDEIPRPQPQPSSSSSSAPSGSAGSAGYMPGGFPWSAFGFGGADGGAKQGSASDRERAHDKFSSDQFGNVFEEMLRDEGMAEGENASPTHKFWSFVGALSGGAMGFIIANFPGAVAVSSPQLYTHYSSRQST